ncbi:hypothetical protein FRB95_004908 [Tulasnella sp. JGI-2019a]|nr:hypothetical protein FRB95_004908 [Tulasnella sp. JGI-2019a]
MESPTLVETDPGGRAVSFSEFALNLWRGHPSKAPSLIDLIVGLWNRYTASSFLMNTHRTNISLSKNIIRRSTTVPQSNTATSAVGDSDPEPRAMSLLAIALDFQKRFLQAKDRIELDNAVGYIEQAMDLLHDGHPARAKALYMGVCLTLGFRDNTGRRELYRRIECLEEVLKLVPEGHPETLISLSILVDGLYARFKQTGDRSDLDQSINYGRRVLDLRPEGYLDRSTSLCSLATGLLTRFQQNGGRSDLDHSVKYHRQALDLRPEEHPDRSVSLSHLANGLLTRFEQNRDGCDLDTSINYYKEVLDLVPGGHANRSASLPNFANGL